MNVKKTIKKYPQIHRIFKFLKSIFLYVLNKYKNIFYLSNNGERVDINLNKNVKLEELGMNEKCHYLRYEFAEQYIKKGWIVGDLACGTGYGSIILSKKSKEVIGIDINERTIKSISKRYEDIENVKFFVKNLLEIDYINKFNFIASFETIEHLKEVDIYTVLNKYNKALQNSGLLIFSTPYMQIESVDAVSLGYHLTFDINEEKIKEWLYKSNFELKQFLYQSYEHPELTESLHDKQFIICIAIKK